MENEIQLENQNFEMQVTTSAMDFLKESAKWCKFMAILGFIGIGLMVIIALVMTVGLSAFDGLTKSAGIPFPMAGFSLIYLLFAALYFFPVWYLYQYSVKTTAALHTKNSQMLADGFENLKSHHKFLGIFTLVIISIYALIFLIGIFIGITAAAN